MNMCSNNVGASHEPPRTLPGMCRDDLLKLLIPLTQRRSHSVWDSLVLNTYGGLVEPAIG